LADIPYLVTITLKKGTTSGAIGDYGFHPFKGSDSLLPQLPRQSQFSISIGRLTTTFYLLGNYHLTAIILKEAKGGYGILGIEEIMKATQKETHPIFPLPLSLKQGGQSRAEGL
jgi:hypothetical protein